MSFFKPFLLSVLCISMFTPTLSAQNGGDDRIEFNLKVDSVRISGISLSWSNVAYANFKSYNLYRLDVNNDTTVFNDIIDPFFTDTTVQLETTYVYWLTLFDVNEIESHTSYKVRVNSFEFTQHYTWDFESGNEGWLDFFGASIIIDSVSYSGFQSALVRTPMGESFGTFGISEITPEIGQTFRFHFLLPEVVSSINSISIAYETNTSSGVIFEEHPIDKFEAGTWNEVTYTIKEPYEQTASIIFNVVANSASTPDVYLDFVTTELREHGIPTLSTPTQLTAHSIFEGSNAIISWKTVTGNGPIKFNIYRTESCKSKGCQGSDELVGSTENIFHIIEDFEDYDKQYYFVAAEDFAGRETLASNVRSVGNTIQGDTKFDFEQNTLQDWEPVDTEATITKEEYFSGVASVELSTQAQVSSFQLVDTANTNQTTSNIRGKITLGETIRFYVLLDGENLQKLNYLEIYTNDGQWIEASKKFEADIFKANTWKKLSYVIPTGTADLNSTGLRIVGLDDTTRIKFNIDMIHTTRLPNIAPHLEVPKNVEVTKSGLNYTITWSPSTGNDQLNEYEVLFKQADWAHEYDYLTQTRNTYYSGRIPRRDIYEFAVFARSDDGMRTEPGTIEVSFLPVSNEDEANIPTRFSLAKNYPNPFNPSTTIQFDVPITSFVILEIFDINGKLIQTLVNEQKSPGTYSMIFQASGLSSGLYFYKLSAGNFIETQKMLLIK